MPKLAFAPTKLSKDFCNGLASRIVVADRKKLREHVYFFLVMGALSTVALIPTLNWLMRDLHTSGFMSYLSLVTSDLSVVTTSLKEFGLSLLESLPVFSLIATLMFLTVCMWSVVSLLFGLYRLRGRGSVLFK